MLDYLKIILTARRSDLDQRGASAVEYGLLIAGIAAVIALVVYAFGGVVLSNLFQSTCQTMSSSVTSGGSCS